MKNTSCLTVGERVGHGHVQHMELPKVDKNKLEIELNVIPFLLVGTADLYS